MERIMDKYFLNVLVRDRLDILNRITTLFIQKYLPVESVSYNSTADNMAVINLICFCPDENIMKRIVNQANTMVDVSEVYYTKAYKAASKFF